LVPHPCAEAIWWVNFDPTRGSEIRKTRPAIVVTATALNWRVGRSWSYLFLPARKRARQSL
jgi:mRNA-degrading endonuclease toxin of MazEF toxin-antitoxin module